jgi:hypothetical protein
MTHVMLPDRFSNSLVDIENRVMLELTSWFNFYYAYFPLTA